MRAAGLLTLTLGLLALGTLPESITSLLFFTLAILLALAPPAVIFSGFTTGAFWLVFGGMILGEAVKTSGLADRLAALFLRGRSLDYPGFIGRIVILGTALCFVMPSTPARVLLLVPLITAMTGQLNLRPGGRGHVGACVAGILSTYQAGAAVLSANVPNLVLAGGAETVYGLPIRYLDYLVIQFPVMGLLKLLSVWLVTVVLFKERVQLDTEGAQPRPLTGVEKRLAIILFLALVLWATDTLHGINPGWISLAAATICLLPPSRISPPSVLTQGMNFGALLYLAAALGLGTMVTHTGLDKLLSSPLTSLLALQPGHPFENFLALTTMATFTGMVTTNPAQPALLVPLASQFAATAEWPLFPVLMSFAVGFSTVIFPYQVPPIVIGLQVAGISTRRSLRLILPLAAIGLLVLLPLNYLWWQVLRLLSGTP